MRKLFTFGLATFIFAAASGHQALHAAQTQSDPIDVEIGIGLFDQDAVFIDVRTAQAFAEGHVSGAVNLDLASAFTQAGLAAHVPEGATMVGVKARSTLVPAEDWVKEFIPYGTPCEDAEGNRVDCIEKLEGELAAMKAEIAELKSGALPAPDKAEPEIAKKSGTDD